MGVGSELAQGLWKGFVKGSKGAVKTGADELFEKALKNGSAQKVFNTFPEEDLFNWKPLIESQNPEALSDLKSGLGNAAINENYQELLNVNTRLKEINDSMPSDAKVPQPSYQLSEGVEDFIGDTDLPAARSWLQPGGELDQLAESKFLTAGTKRKVKDPTGKTIEVQKGAKLTRDQLSKTDQDYYDSLMATGFKTSPDDELAYGFGASELSKMAGLEGFDPEFSPQLHKGKTFHHMGMKKIRSTIHKRARQLVREGKATVDDLVNLHAMSVAKGSPSGSRKSAGMWLEEFGHNITHKKVSQDPEFGYEPTTTKAVNEFRGGGKTKPKNIPAKVWNPANEAALNLDVTLTPFDIEYINIWAEAYKILIKLLQDGKYLDKVTLMIF